MKKGSDTDKVAGIILHNLRDNTSVHEGTTDAKFETIDTDRRFFFCSLQPRRRWLFHQSGRCEFRPSGHERVRFASCVHDGKDDLEVGTGDQENKFGDTSDGYTSSEIDTRTQELMVSGDCSPWEGLRFQNPPGTGLLNNPHVDRRSVMLAKAVCVSYSFLPNRHAAVSLGRLRYHVFQSSAGPISHFVPRGL